MGYAFVDVKKFSNKILVLSGKNDVILDIKYNDKFRKDNNIQNIYLERSHSLFEEIDKSFLHTIKFLDDKL